MNILILYNDFGGAYGSLGIFQNELKGAVKNSDKLYISRNARDTEKICLYTKIDFSIGIGEFQQYINSTPIYELTQIHHYQWIIDNPMKIDIDVKSSLITYILINKSFIFNIGICKNTPLYIPLGYADCIPISQGIKKTGIVFSGQIKSANIDIEHEIFKSSYKKMLWDFIEFYECNLWNSFEENFATLFNELPLNERKKTFRFLNTYFRTIKRKKIIQSIKEYPVYIVGEVLDQDILNQKNIHLVGRKKYAEVWSVISQYMFSLNINPNFQDAIHDRIIRSICYGTIPVSDEGDWCKTVFGASMVYYSYHKPLDLEPVIANYSKNSYKEQVIEIQNRVGAFQWNNIINMIKEKNSNEL